jgi:hypothetical protein
MDFLRNQVLPAVATGVASSVKDKLVSTARGYLCNDENKSMPKVNRKMGDNRGDIRRMGISNQRIRRRMGV